MSTMQNALLSHLRSLAAKQASGALSDRQLLEQFRSQRSETAFAALVRRHGPMVWNVCRRLLGNHHDTEDAFQAVFLIFARKAASIRKKESVSSFLHSIAYHTATKLKLSAARRAARERMRASPSSVDPCDDITWRELRSVLDEELAKLSEQHRAPLVLCYLEGKTQDEAARLLGWSKNTFARRMNEARQMLARRLTRRGLTLPAALTAPLLIDGAAQAALPPLLAASTVRAGLAATMGHASSGIVSAQVIALAESGTASLLSKKMSVALVLLMSMMLGIGGLLAHRAVHRSTFAEAPPAPPPPDRSASKDTSIEIKGRVLGPDGKPFAGAHVFLLPNGDPKQADRPIRATSDNDGRFRFPARKGKIVATATGLGLDWIDVDTKSKSEEITLRLVADDVPIEGRVLDLEGKPIAGATVKILRLGKREGNADLASWVEKNIRMRAKGVLMEMDELKTLAAENLVDAPTTATTQADGRFRLAGLGRERVARLAIQGPGIEFANLWALTRSGPARGWCSGQWGLYGSSFDWLAGPCKPITGTVRDKTSGKPVPGIRVSCVGLVANGKTATTDGQGRYRIDGAGKRNDYHLVAWGLPYLDSFRLVADTPALEPLTVDFQVQRGIEITGRLIDARTGRPVRGSVRYRALPDNPNLKDFNLDFILSTTGMIEGRAGEDGVFRTVAIPGPGLVVVSAEEGEHFLEIDELDALRRSGAARILFKEFERTHAVVRIDLSGKEAKAKCSDISLVPAPEKRVKEKP